MKTSLTRTVLALCATAAVAVLSACGGATSTVDPFKPTRVIGLGDAHNDMHPLTQYTVRGTATVSTVVEQIAALFGVTTVQSSVRTGDSTVADLNAQVTALNSLQASDLIVITSGTADYLAHGSAGAADYLRDLKTALNTLKAKGATHILLMSVVDKSAAVDSDLVTFNWIVSGGLTEYSNILRLANINRPAAYFPNWATNTNTPYCGVGSVQGCAVDARDSTLYFLADSVYPTPAGNRWIAQYLYNVTSQGWR